MTASMTRRRAFLSWVQQAHEEYTEAPLLAVMLVLSFHSLADGVMRSGYVTQRPLAWLWAAGVDYAIWAGYRRIRQGHWEGWLLVVPGSAATVAFQTILAGHALTWHALVPPGFVVVSLFVMERIRTRRARDARPGQPWAELHAQIDAFRTQLTPAPEPVPAAPAPRPSQPRLVRPRPETPARTTGTAWTQKDLADMVRVYETTTGGSKARRSAVTAQSVIPWAVVEAELKRLGHIGTRAPDTNGNEA
jgi:hypothetical protein